MKTFNIFVIGLISLSGSFAASLLRYGTTDDTEPLPETSRVTAFVVDEMGKPSVECWEVGDLIPDQRVQRSDGSKGIIRGHSLITDGQDLDGVDILTWPAYSPIWPPGSLSVHESALDMSSSPAVFSVKDGLVHVRRTSSSGTVTATDSEEDHIFADLNGDDWFYFEDSTTSSSAKSADEQSPFTISTISGSETELIRFRFAARPTHRKLHDGACTFAGITTPDEGSKTGKGLVANPPLGTEEL